MVRAVMTLAAAALGAVPAAAMGPQEPFVPPGAVATLQASGTAASAVPAARPVLPLAGVRLGRLPAALIDGEWVAEGAQVRGARLLRVWASGAELRHADGRIERLSLFGPDSSPPAAAPAASVPTEAASRDTP